MEENKNQKLFSQNGVLPIIINGEEYTRILPPNFIVENSKLYEIEKKKDKEGNIIENKNFISSVIPNL